MTAEGRQDHLRRILYTPGPRTAAGWRGALAGTMPSMRKIQGTGKAFFVEWIWLQPNPVHKHEIPAAPCRDNANHQHGFRNKAMAQGVHFHQRRHTGGVTKIVAVLALCVGRRQAQHTVWSDSCVPPVFPQEWKRQTTEVRAATRHPTNTSGTASTFANCSKASSPMMV